MIEIEKTTNLEVTFSKQKIRNAIGTTKLNKVKTDNASLVQLSKWVLVSQKCSKESL